MKLKIDSVVQSICLGCGQPVNELEAEGHVDKSGQHPFPAHSDFVPGHVTESPTLQCIIGGVGGDGGDGGDGGGGGDGGDGGDGGEGPGWTQSSFFGDGQHPKSSSADGHVEPSGQQVLPLQPFDVPGHVTASPTLHFVSPL
jgi:hypothetical protein